MSRIILYILMSISIWCIWSGPRVSAAPTYTPGDTIAMTGSNASTRFDVASILSSYGTSGPILDTNTLYFSGAFYAQHIGWVVFASGSTHQVRLNCGGQDIKNLTLKCTFGGKAWSENVGDIDFGHVDTTAKYNPNTGRIEGSVMSYAGLIDLSGIALPLRPVTLSEFSIRAGHHTTLTSQDGWIYDGGIKTWIISITPQSELYSKITIGESNGVFRGIDLSLATYYRIDITDSNGSRTSGISLRVTPGLPSRTLIGGSYFAEDFCHAFYTTAGALCPDGSERSPSSQSTQPSVARTIFANGSDAYDVHLRSRDIYGNRVDFGEFHATYTNTVRAIQPSTYAGDISNPGDASKIRDQYISPLDSSGVRVITLPCLCGGDSFYQIKSIAPTNSSPVSSNKIQLLSIIWKDGATEVPLFDAGTPLEFASPFGALTTHGPIYVDYETTLQTELLRPDTSGTLTSIVPDVITTLLVRDGSDTEWQGLSSDPTQTCMQHQSLITGPTDDLCDWNTESSIAISANSTPMITIRGTYTPLTSPTAPSNTTLTTLLRYTIDGRDVLYPIEKKILDVAEIINMRYKIIGSSSQTLNTLNTRTDTYNSIRQRIAIAARNRTNYNDVNYDVIGHDITIDDMSVFNTKQTIVSLGGDIRINSNIDITDLPLALIALSDVDGNGGNIIIGSGVTDLHVSLVSERSLLSETSSKQLYIHGSVISSNELKKVPPTTCPYYISGTCIPGDFDLPGQRYGFSTLIDNTGKTSLNTRVSTDYPKVPIVFEPESRLMQNPPPLMLK